MSFWAEEKVFICADCRHWWLQEASFFGTYKENPQHICEACGGEGEEASEEMQNFILGIEPTGGGAGNAAMFDAELMALEDKATERASEQGPETHADVAAEIDVDADGEAEGEAGGEGAGEGAEA